MLKPHILNLFIATALGVAASPVLALDTGDAPASYGNATHEVVAGAAQLGEVAPDDNDPLFSALADADDFSESLDDEDGVRAFPTLVQNSKAYTTNVFLKNDTGTTQFLSGWVDYDGSGTFDADEFSTSEVPPSATPGQEIRIKLTWPSLTGITTDFIGTSFARFRISSQPIGAADSTGSFPDGEVEDYALQILSDFDSDEIPDIEDLDNDNDGIPDLVEGSGDTDSDGIIDSLDFDSDGDTIADFVEAGEDPTAPVDTDGDGIPDFIDLDSNADGIPDSVVSGEDTDFDGIPDSIEGAGDFDGDGILNVSDIDSDNDLIPDAVEFGNGPGANDTDGDGVPDFLDVDSDNDGITDIHESNILTVPVFILDADADGQVDSNFIFGANGYVDQAETDDDSGIPIFALADSDGDGLRDFKDLDSDADGITDALEGGAFDSDGDGIVDNGVDADGDGLFDGVINFLSLDGTIPDNDFDVLNDFQDVDADGSTFGPVGAAVTPPAPTPVAPEPVTPVAPVVTPTPLPTEPVAVADANGAIIQTGLNGVAGCSVNGTGKEGTLSILALLSLLMLGARRRKAQTVKSRIDD